MHSLSSTQLKRVLYHLPKRFHKESIKYWEKDRNLINLFDTSKDFVTSIDPDYLKEDVISIDNRLKKLGRPACKYYFVRRNMKRVSMCPIGASWWYYLPYETKEDIETFFRNIDARGESKGIVADLFTKGSVLIRVPENREPFLKDIFKKGESANPFKKVTQEDLSYIQEHVGRTWKI